MSKREAGFSLVELLIAMLMFVFVIAASSQMFTAMLTQFKQQSKIAETSTEGIIGLEILRQDVEHAGYGLPWAIPAGITTDTYNEAEEADPCGSGGSADPSDYNDSTLLNPPRAVLNGNNNCTNNSDYLVLKATNIATNNASSKWTYLRALNIIKEWEPDTERLETSDRVIVLNLTATRALVADETGEGFTTRYLENGGDPDSLANANFAPPDNTITRTVYGVTPPVTGGVGTPLRMPFNRADYYVDIPDDNMPSRCADNTGVLYKSTLNHADGELTPLPLLDCVADMQVGYGIDTDPTPDGVVNCYVNNLADVLAAVDAENIRNRVRDIRVYILAHEGQIDRDFTFDAPVDTSSIRVGEPFNVLPGGNACTALGEDDLGKMFDLADISTTDSPWQNYRWKLYTIVTKPYNLR
ncbi:MAG: prepilin-type N-terminal cleavage/methylation domain-containing protein [Nitrospirae bacterium]|nr:prepilin-type N-terminal cleavage/methylation domain-containing protein [Nitrospirota bacterium]